MTTHHNSHGKECRDGECKDGSKSGSCDSKCKDGSKSGSCDSKCHGECKDSSKKDVLGGSSQKP